MQKLNSNETFESPAQCIMIRAIFFYLKKYIFDFILAKF